MPKDNKSISPQNEGNENESHDNHENIRVGLRLRPMNKLEISRRSRKCVRINNNGCDNGVVSIDSPLEGALEYRFDQVFDEKSSQSSVYQFVKSLAKDVLEGYSCALVAYGNTGTGKTHTLMGTSTYVEGCALGSSSTGLPSDSGSKTTRTASDSQTSEINEGESVAFAEKESKDIEFPSSNNEDDESIGIIPRAVKDIFSSINESPGRTEFIVRCSYLLIYMEKMLDLLVPTAEKLTVIEAPEEFSGSSAKRDFPLDKGSVIEGLSEVCCIDEADVVALLVRGNASRTLLCNKLSTDPCRTHGIFIMNIEQRDSATGLYRQSRVHFADLAGSEFGEKAKSRVKVQSGLGTVQLETALVNKGFAGLGAVVKSLLDNQTLQAKVDIESTISKRSNYSSHKTPHRKSKVTSILKEVFGGNCRTHVILTVAPSSYTIGETIGTVQFGKKLMPIINCPITNEASTAIAHKSKLEQYEKSHAELISLVKALTLECHKLKSIGLRGKITKESCSGPLWQNIDYMIQHLDSASDDIPAFVPKIPSNNIESKEDTTELKSDIISLTNSRDQAISALANKQSEIVMLKNKIQSLEKEKRQSIDDGNSVQNQVKVLTTQVLELENKVRTSQFRENEAIIFLRQFRKFYRRLLRNKSAQGTGAIAEIIATMPGVPDLQDLVDIDLALFQSGLIEEKQVHDDGVGASFRPSSEALQRSAYAAADVLSDNLLDASENSTNHYFENHMSPPITHFPHGLISEYNTNQDVLSDSRDTQSSFIYGTLSRESSAYLDDSGNFTKEDVATLTARGKLPTIRYSSRIFDKAARENELETALSTMSDKCLQLQIEVNEAKCSIDVLTNRSGSLNQKRLAQEAISLRQSLERKNHDLQLIIWKMNELNLINMAHNEKMTNRNFHVKHLEECIVNLQNNNRNLTTENHQSETKLKDELEHLLVLIDAMTIPLWQFGECKVSKRVLPTRVLLPAKSASRENRAPGHMLHQIICPDRKHIDEDIRSQQSISSLFDADFHGIGDNTHHLNKAADDTAQYSTSTHSEYLLQVGE